MKKIFALFLSILLILPLAACSAQRPADISADHSTDTPPESSRLLQSGVWPENGYTEGLPVPPGTVDWAMVDEAWGSCAVQLSGVSEEQFDAYYDKLLNADLAEIKKTGEDTAYVSIGTILSDGRKSLSLAYADPVLMLTITDQGIDDSQRKFWQSRDLTNVYVNSYATYDPQSGVQVVTELYVPESEKVKPKFSLVSGYVTITLGGNTTTHYFGATPDGDAAVGAVANTGIVGKSGDQGTVVISGSAYASNAIAGGGSFTISYDITLP